MAKSFVGVQEGTDKNIGTYKIVEDGIEKHFERVCIGTGEIVLPDTPQIDSVTTSGIYPDTSIEVTGMGYIVIKSLFTNNVDSINIRIILYDVNDKIIGETDSIIISPTDLQENTKYVGDLVIFENKIGTSKIKIKLESDLSTDNSVSFYIAGI